MEDMEIITMYFERQETAIQETKNKYGVYLNVTAYNILRSLEDTEEVVDDTYMAAWNTMPPTKPENLKYFLSRITRNLSFNRLDYKNAGKRRALFVELDECIPDKQNDVEMQDIIMLILSEKWQNNTLFLNVRLSTCFPKRETGCVVVLKRKGWCYEWSCEAE